MRDIDADFRRAHDRWIGPAGQVAWLPRDMWPGKEFVGGLKRALSIMEMLSFSRGTASYARFAERCDEIRAEIAKLSARHSCETTIGARDSEVVVREALRRHVEEAKG